ncbi:MAG: NAD-dependent epimerase/dehydratase family protein [Bacteroidales bacterium]|nr:NAD-dependent epimerase/dehydratase family protein [Bacteroidales bacterium]
MIVITGAAGFIGSCMVRHLNESGRDDLVLVDDFPVMHAETCHDSSLHREGVSLQEFRYLEKIPCDFFFDWAAQNIPHIDFIFHFGMETVGMQADEAMLREYNLEFSQRLWSLAAMNRIPLLFVASSVDTTWRLLSLNGKLAVERRKIGEQYKLMFDNWVLKQRITPPLWAGFSMPEVYGPNETHLSAAASSVFQLFRQWQKEGRMVIPLYENSEGSDNEPIQDRIFVKDVVTVFTWFKNHLPASGFYYLGPGYPRPLSAVAAAIFSALKLPPQVEFQIISSADIHLSQENNTLPLNRINCIGYKKNFTPLEKGVRLYVKNILNE